MTGPLAVACNNGEPIPTQAVPAVSFDDFSKVISDAISRNDRLVALFAQPSDSEQHQLYSLTTMREKGNLQLTSTLVRREYPSLTPSIPQAHWFEREVAELWDLRPIGHPWLKPIRFSNSPIGDTQFFSVLGHDVHEVAVGPVHAGVIEPGHFRFSCAGERVMHLEISLGYQHRGIEKALVGGPTVRTIPYVETLAGDTSVGHATAYCQNAETLSGTKVPLRGMRLRSIALELERLANHTGDLGALAGDVGYLPVAAHCGRIRGDFLNLTALICGNRLGRGIARPGGVGYDLSGEQVSLLREKLEQAYRDLKRTSELIWETPSLISRYEGTGLLTGEQCRQLGVVGIAARAAGIEQDARLDYPSDLFSFAQIPVSLWHTGDVFGRAYVRWLEIMRSVDFVRTQLIALREGPSRQTISQLRPDTISISLVEGWRGEICHVACTDSTGKFKWYKVVDPSFHNWAGLAMAMRNQQISDFPLCNKSFNLSYCGHDL